MALEQVYRSYYKAADKILWKDKDSTNLNGEHTKGVDCNSLFFNYIIHENDNLKDNYFAGIVCRYWGYIGKIYTKLQRNVPIEQCYDIVIDAIRYVLSKRVWENPNSSLYHDEKAPDKAMKVAMKRQMGIEVNSRNTDKRKSNFNPMSLDGAHEDYADATDGLFFELESSEQSITLKALIENYITKGDMLGAIIIDSICYTLDKYKEATLVSYLQDIDKVHEQRFIDTYDNVTPDMFKNLRIEIYQMTKNQLKNKIRGILYNLRKDLG